MCLVPWRLHEAVTPPTLLLNRAGSVLRELLCGKRRLQAGSDRCQEEGKHQARWRLGDLPPRDFAQPQWRGEPLAGKTILLHAEQGMGDTVQFMRYVPLVAARGGLVVLQVPQPLLQKDRTTTWPRCSERRTLPPATACRVKSGAGRVISP